MNSDLINRLHMESQGYQPLLSILAEFLPEESAFVDEHSETLFIMEEASPVLLQVASYRMYVRDHKTNPASQNGNLPIKIDGASTIMGSESLERTLKMFSISRPQVFGIIKPSMRAKRYVMLWTY